MEHCSHNNIRQLKISVYNIISIVPLSIAASPITIFESNLICYTTTLFPQSLNILRVKIFAEFVVLSLALKILILKYLSKHAFR